MSLKPEPIDPVPEETPRIARAAFPKGNLYLRLRDELGTLYQVDLFADLFPSLIILDLKFGHHAQGLLKLQQLRMYALVSLQPRHWSFPSQSLKWA